MILTGEPMIDIRMIALPALVLALGAGCKNQIDNKDAENKVKAWAETDVGPVKSVSCPKTEMKAGASFDCNVTFAEGGSYKLTVTQTDGEGNVEWKWATPVVGAERISAAVAGALKEQRPDTDPKIDCGTGIKEMPPEGLTCKLDAGGQQSDIVIKVDADGLAWELK